MKKRLDNICFLIFAILLMTSLYASEKRDFEENQQNESLIFVILAHVKSQGSESLWQRCYQSVREFYPDENIVIIDDNSSIPISGDALENTLVIRSEFPGAGELLPYYYFVEQKWADKMVFLHDSMYLIRKFKPAELNHSVRFHWCFTDHGCDDDDLIEFYLSHLNEADSLIEFNRGKQWWGCFGVASIISLNVLEQIENKYGFTTKLAPLVNSRHQRMALERIFAILIFKEQYVNYGNCCNYGDYIGIFHFNPKNVDQCAIVKTFHGR